MSCIHVFLYTNALIALAGIKNPELMRIKNLIETRGLKLRISHIQIDEMIDGVNRSYEEKRKKALNILKQKGISTETIETPITVVGVSRYGLSKIGDDRIHRLYEELKHEIERCEKGKPKLNLIRDAVTALSSLDNDYFITCDWCVYKSWNKVIGKHKSLEGGRKIPGIIYARPKPKYVAESIISLF